MQLDLSHFPQTLDLLHLILAAVALIAIVIAALKKGASVQGSIPQTATATVPAIAAPVAAHTAAPAAAHAAVHALKSTEPESALQLLSLLQQEARLVDFLNEDVKAYSDAEVGAAARVVHEGGKKVLNEYFSLQPVRTESEESRITLPEGYDAAAVRLTGNVVGQAPFSGVLVHRGWQVADIKLPKITEGRNLRVIAPAEVEL